MFYLEIVTSGFIIIYYKDAYLFILTTILTMIDTFSRAPVHIRVNIPKEVGAVLKVVLTIYDLDGHLIRSLLATKLGPGTHIVNWDGCNDAGRPVPPGMYFYYLIAGNYHAINKVTLNDNIDSRKQSGIKL
ncbi:MAG: FlgD immunoglobulin-like domain containing protein [Candidatus Glassbacteria bacterium]